MHSSRVALIPLRATTLTPFAYHSVAVQGGTATLPMLISDTALAFGLAATLGMMASRSGLPPKNYRAHLTAMPYRTSLLLNPDPRLLPPLARRLNVDEDAGYQKNIQSSTNSGNVKTFFTIQEVPAQQQFQGALFGLDGFDPFTQTSQHQLVIRVGLHRNGMVLLERDPEVSKVHLNAATAHLFDRSLPVSRYSLYNLQWAPAMSLEQAAAEASQWH